MESDHENRVVVVVGLHAAVRLEGHKTEFDQLGPIAFPQY